MYYNNLNFRMTRTMAQVKNYNKIEFEVEKVIDKKIIGKVF